MEKSGILTGSYLFLGYCVRIFYPMVECPVKICKFQLPRHNYSITAIIRKCRMRWRKVTGSKSGQTNIKGRLNFSGVYKKHLLQ